MKLSEVIAELEKNPNKKFARILPDRSAETLHREGDFIRLADPFYSAKPFHLRQGWKEVVANRKVSFVEAMKALDEGKTVYVLTGDNRYTFEGKYKDSTLLMSLKEINYGKWFIEEEEE